MVEQIAGYDQPSAGFDKPRFTLPIR